ncbi:MAG: phage terminase small subunit P27 family [Saprospiraceae bacterium]
MTRGRPPKSAAIKKMEGTYRKDRDKKDTISFNSVKEIPDPPEMFDHVARNVWNTICTELIQLNLLQSIDVFNLQIICNEMSIYWKCMTQMGSEYTISTGTGSEKVNPLYTAATTALTNANKLAAQYGFTPAARMRLKLGTSEQKTNGNAAIELINRKKQLK